MLPYDGKADAPGASVAVDATTLDGVGLARSIK